MGGVDDIFDRVNARAVIAARAFAAVARDDFRPIWGVVVAGLARGARDSEMVKDAIVAGCNPHAAAKIIDTMLAMANSRAALASLVEAESMGVLARKGWMACGDACEVCAGNAREGGIELRQPFQSGHMTPPAHVGCRCCLISAFQE